MKPAKLPGQDATQLELHVAIIEANARIAELEAAIRALIIDSQNADFPGGHPFRKSWKNAITVLGDDPT